MNIIRFIQINTGCEYGDKSDWCGTNFQHSTDNYICYLGTSTVNNSDLCCKTCDQYKNNNRPDCLYGDRSYWCSYHIQSARNAHLCYMNERLCCGTCGQYARNHKEGIPLESIVMIMFAGSMSTIHNGVALLVYHSIRSISIPRGFSTIIHFGILRWSDAPVKRGKITGKLKVR
ncbi:hypothetical protein CHS0354_042448 [Potamilus streckersoni]|uniref:Uncharacterized protein n=1 Tax=Potamilus streckersoni TaxID=2493646 RepID=A0AAE0S9C5_9BIVA|nr:hypothetical protein CHS0354_042448 [Potamilus streckersoni]